VRSDDQRSGLAIFILSGGQSSRMGRSKAELRLGRKTFLQIITQAAGALSAPVYNIDKDAIPKCGPLSGVFTAFETVPFDRALFLSCDMPLLSSESISDFVRGAAPNAVRFTRENGKAGFPFILPSSVRSVVVELLIGGERSLQRLSQRANANFHTPTKARRQEYLNVNTPVDYKRAVRIWSAARRSLAILEVRNLSVRRGAVHLLSAFTWKVNHGEHWVVLGANGCGKTSLFNALVGYLSATSGDIYVLGEEYGNSDWPALRKRIGLVSSSIRQMMPESEPAWITVASGKYAMIDYWGIPKRRDKSAALRILRDIECEYLSERPWAVLSQGERQRVLIGRALMVKPTLLILDEPCAGLDPAAREHFLNFLDELGRRKNAPALVLVTHHVEEIMPVFTHALLMKSGTKLAEGPVGSLITSKKLSDTFDSPLHVRKAAGRYQLRVRRKNGVII
jgi:iron complex transport system ATP-binding protein